MSDILFIHSPNLHEAHRMFAEALYSPSGRKALGERCFAEAIEADFEHAYDKEFRGFREFLEAFKLEGGMPMFPIKI